MGICAELRSAAALQAMGNGKRKLCSGWGEKCATHPAAGALVCGAAVHGGCIRRMGTTTRIVGCPGRQPCAPAVAGAGAGAAAACPVRMDARGRGPGTRGRCALSAACIARRMAARPGRAAGAGQSHHRSCHRSRARGRCGRSAAPSACGLALPPQGPAAAAMGHGRPRCSAAVRAGCPGRGQHCPRRPWPLGAPGQRWPASGPLPLVGRAQWAGRARAFAGVCAAPGPPRPAGGCAVDAMLFAPLQHAAAHPAAKHAALPVPRGRGWPWAAAARRGVAGADG